MHSLITIERRLKKSDTIFIVRNLPRVQYFATKCFGIFALIVCIIFHLVKYIKQLRFCTKLVSQIFPIRKLL